MQTGMIGMNIIVTAEMAAKIVSIIGGQTLAAVMGSDAPAKPAKTKTKKAVEEKFDLSGGTGANGDKSLDEMTSEEQAEVEDEVTQTMEDEQPPLTLAQVASHCKADKPKALKTLAKFKIKSLSELKPAQYQTFVDALAN